LTIASVGPQVQESGVGWSPPHSGKSRTVRTPAADILGNHSLQFRNELEDELTPQGLSDSRLSWTAEGAARAMPRRKRIIVRISLDLHDIPSTRPRYRADDIVLAKNAALR
jgi:hypothetical protein